MEADPVHRIFLCHSSKDKPQVRDLYSRLRRDGFQPWLDEEDLLPGQNWEIEITRAVRGARVVLACMSASSVTRSGYVQKEIKQALDVADEQPEGQIFLIPVKLEECVIPDRLRRFQWVDLQGIDGYDRLKLALYQRIPRPEPRRLAVETRTVSGSLSLDHLSDTLTSHEQLSFRELTALSPDPDGRKQNLATFVHQPKQLGRIRIYVGGTNPRGTKLFSTEAYVSGTRTKIDVHRRPLEFG